MRKFFSASLSTKIVFVFSGMLFFFSLVLGAGSYLFKNTLNSVFSNYHENVLTAFNEYYTSDVQSNRLSVISDLLDEKIDLLSNNLRDLETNVDVISLIAIQGFDDQVDRSVEIINPDELAMRPEFRKTLVRNANFTSPVSFVFPDIMINDRSYAAKYSELYWRLRPLFQSIYQRADNSLWSYIGFERDGSVINFPGNFSEPGGYDPRKRPWYTKAHEAKGNITWTTPYFDTGNRSLVLTVAKASYGSDRRRPIFVAASDIVADRLIRELIDININEDLLSVIILNENNQIVYKREDEDRLGHWDSLPKYTSASSYFSPDEYKAYLQVENRNYASFEFKKSKLFIFKRTMPQTKWTIVFLLNQTYTTEFINKINGKFEELAKKSVSAIRESELLSNRVLSFAALMLIVFSSGWYFLMKRIIVRPLSQVLHYIKNFSKLNVNDFEFALAGAREDEIAALTTELVQLKRSQLLYERSLVREEVLKVKAQINAQVAHDIRSPLSALNMVASTLTDVPGQKRDLIINATQRINDIANQLLRESRASDGFGELRIRGISIATLLESIVTEKRIQFSDLRSVQIIDDLPKDLAIFVKVDPAEFSRVMSNLINNSVEALDSHGSVTISLLSEDHQVRVVIRDSGKGMPTHILERLGQRGVSYGKDGTGSGTGLGIYHAMTTIEAFGGKFEIRSSTASGTVVTLTLPKAEGPSEYSPNRE